MNRVWSLSKSSFGDAFVTVTFPGYLNLFAPCDMCLEHQSHKESYNAQGVQENVDAAE